GDVPSDTGGRDRGRRVGTAVGRVRPRPLSLSRSASMKRNSERRGVGSFRPEVTRLEDRLQPGTLLFDAWLGGGLPGVGLGDALQTRGRPNRPLDHDVSGLRVAPPERVELVLLAPRQEGVEVRTSPVAPHAAAPAGGAAWGAGQTAALTTAAGVAPP